MLRRTFAVVTAKLIVMLSRLLGKKGTFFAGKIAYKLCPHLLKDYVRQVKKEIIVVLGTNGKTTTNNLIYKILTDKGHKVVCNNLGANMLFGLVNAFVSYGGLTGKIDADYAALEIDEAWATHIFEHFTPDKIVITNLFRDQLDRYGEIDITMDYIGKALQKAPDCTLILNGDDPLCASFGQQWKGRVIYFGIDEQCMPSVVETKEGQFCTFCRHPLSYEYYHYSQLGKYKCTNCDFERPKLDFKATGVSIQHGLSFTINETQPISLDYRGLYNIYNILAAVAATSDLGVQLSELNDILSTYRPQIGRMESYHFKKKDVILNLAKNPAGFNQAIATVTSDKRTSDVIVVINDNDQDGRDISWIWDVDFEKFNVEHILSFTAAGIRKHDTALRLKHALFNERQVLMFNTLREAVQHALASESEIVYLLINYTALFSSQKILTEMIKDESNA